jgi:hypothetical protein
MCVSNLCDKREQHAKQDYGYISLGQTLCTWVRIHITINSRVIVRMR